MAKSSAPSNVLKSQLEVMSGKVATIAPQSSLARFVYGELKGGEHKHNYAMSVIRSAIEQALKGNQRDIPEAVALCVGKSVKAKAYHAGFHAIADMTTPVKYVGKFDSKENADVRAQVADITHTAFAAFELSYLATFVQAKADAKIKKDEKAAAAAAPAAPAPAAAAPAVESAPAAPAAVESAPEAVEVDIGASVDEVVNALAAGLLSASQIDAIAAALTLRSMLALQAEAPALTATH